MSLSLLFFEFNIKRVDDFVSSQSWGLVHKSGFGVADFILGPTISQRGTIERAPCVSRVAGQTNNMLTLVLALPSKGKQSG